MASILEIIVRQKKEGRAMKQTEKEVKKLGKTIQKLGIGMGSVAGAAVAVGVAMKKAFDLGREGAVIAQTAESFDLLIGSIGASTDLLEELRTSARGTVDDTQLMSSTMTLLAGASKNLAPALANATPRLLEIAKAANKLNPALGDTTFLYQSIATGVKRAQPLILDNLGLTIKVGAANEAMARQLGKTVEELTAEEKAMAILNDTLRAGEILISQVGGSVDSQTDSYDRLQTAIKNTIDIRKKEAAEGLEPVITALADELGFRFQLFEARTKELISLEENIELLNRVRDGTLEQSDVLEVLTLKTEEHRLATEANIAAIDGWQIALLSASDATDDLGESIEPTSEQIEALKESSDRAAAAMENMAINIRIAAGAVDINLTGSIEGFLDKMKFFIAGGGQIEEAFLRLQQALLEKKITPEQAQEFAGELFVAAQDLERDLGEITASEAAKNIKETLGGSLRDAKEQLDAIDEGLLSLPDKITIQIEFETLGDPFGGLPPVLAPGGKHGLEMTVPTGFPNDSFPILASSGEHVSITPAGGTTDNSTHNLFAGSTFILGNEMDLAQFEDMLREVLG